jgi:hypothetical protein
VGHPPGGLHIQPLSLAGLLGITPGTECEFGVCVPMDNGYIYSGIPLHPIVVPPLPLVVELLWFFDPGPPRLARSCETQDCFEAARKQPDTIRAGPRRPSALECTFTPGTATPKIPGAAPEQPDGAPGDDPGEALGNGLALIFTGIISRFNCFFLKWFP